MNYKQVQAPFVAMKKAREEKGLKLWELAAEAGLSYNTVRLWERGDNLPNLNDAVLVCNILDVSLDEYVGRAKVEFSPER